MVLQAISIVVSTIFIVAVLGMSHPFKRVSLNYWTIMSESVIIWIMDLLLFSSDPLIETHSRIKIGYAMIAILGLSLFTS